MLIIEPSAYSTLYGILKRSSVTAPVPRYYAIVYNKNIEYYVYRNKKGLIDISIECLEDNSYNKTAKDAESMMVDVLKLCSSDLPTVKYVDYP